MKIFESLKEGFYYQTHCPICSNELRVNDRDAEVKKDNQRFLLTWELTDDALNIDVDTGEAELIIKDPSPATFKPGQATTAYVHGWTPVYSGYLFLRAELECNKCCQYSFLLKILVDLDAKKVSEVQLNSEIVCLEIGRDVHEIKNIYSTDQTEYYRAGFGEAKPLLLPLIPLNLQNPEKTLDRIKKLIIFS